MSLPIAQVVVGLPMPGPFDYLIPLELQGTLKPGMRVLISFRNKLMVGFVTGLLAKSAFPNLKPILRALDKSPILDEAALSFLKEFSQYYACSLGEAIEVSLPAALRTKKETESIFPEQKIAQKSDIRLLQGTFFQFKKELSEQISATINAGQGVLVLVPEIKQIEAIKKVLEIECKSEVAVLDRALTPKAELENWLKVKEGKAKIALGSRSAVFTSVPHLGLVVMVDEENIGYKQEPAPFYHARAVLFLRQAHTPFKLLFVTPAPTVELWKQLKRTDIQEPDSGSTVDAQVIDLSNYKPTKRWLISFPLQNHLQETFNKKGKVLLFLNRRGFSTATRCNSCGFVLKCSRCNVSLSYLYSKKKLVCHRCAATSDLPKICPQCKSHYLRSVGTGIEKLESELARNYPFIKTALVDRETEVLPTTADLVIATSAILPDLDHFQFDLIALLDFDGEINRADFRAGERIFSTMVRLREAAKERFFVQARSADHYSLKNLKKIDFDKFYREELDIRRELDLPPFIHLLALSLRGAKEDLVFEEAKNFYQDLSRFNEGWEVSEPQPDLTPKLRDKYRFTIMVKTKGVKKTLHALAPVLTEFKKRRNTILSINVDP